jgi:uncharacterized protein
MKIELDTAKANINIIKSYSADGVMIKNTLYQGSIIVSPGQIVLDWAPEAPADLSISHFNPILDLSPEIVIIGTGNRLQFPARDIIDSFLIRNIGVEVMDTGAACRAYNFLAGEGRLVVAALIDPGV